MALKWFSQEDQNGGDSESISTLRKGKIKRIAREHGIEVIFTRGQTLKQTLSTLRGKKLDAPGMIIRREEFLDCFRIFFELI